MNGRSSADAASDRLSTTSCAGEAGAMCPFAAEVPVDSKSNAANGSTRAAANGAGAGGSSGTASGGNSSGGGAKGGGGAADSGDRAAAWVVGLWID